MSDIRPRRRVLYMPATNARALEKARTLPADGMVVDLEDAVAPRAKDEARAAAAAAVRAGGFGGREVVIRINGLDTPWGEADLAAAAEAGPDAVLVPKVFSPEEVDAVGSRLRRLGAPDRTRVWAMVETPLAILRIDALASAARDVDSRLACLVLGTNDLAKEMRVATGGGRAPLLPALAMAVTAARAHGIEALDGVYNAHGDAAGLVAGLVAECRQGRDFGFDGKTLIHPSQVAAANAAFAPTDAELADARAILVAFAQPQNRGRGVIALDGRMVERMHAESAARTVALAEAIGGRG